MPTLLRERRSRPSYKDISHTENDDFSVKDGSEESTFEPPAKEQSTAQDSDSAADQMVVDDHRSTGTVSANKKKKKRKSVKADGACSTKGSSSTRFVPGLVMRQQYALPTPSVNHRHRGIPLYFPTQRTIRLADKPRPFSHVNTVWTKSVGDPVVRTRVTKAAGYNIGRGPIWELLEDRSWYKEVFLEDRTRPLVYQNTDPGEFHILLDAQAAPYLPGSSDTDANIACYLGPYEEQTKVNMRRFESQAMRNFFPENSAHVFHAGAPVWSLDWCPVSVEDLGGRNYKQYIALGPLPSYTHHPEIGRRVTRPAPACIQIWSLSPSTCQAESDITKGESGKMDCEMILCVDGGPAHDLKWCPLPAHDRNTALGKQRKLGILGGTFEDGSLSFYVVPDPTSINLDSKSSGPVFVKILPKLRIELDDTACWCLDWGNSDIVAVGCTNGYIAVFRVQEALETPSMNSLRPSNYIAVHQSAIRSLCWVKAPPISISGTPRMGADPTVILSGGYDGAHMVTDIRDGRGNIMSRTRDAINSIAFSHHIGASLASDNENLVKNFSLIPSMLGRGHVVLESSGPVCSIATSDFHPHIAVGSADGTCQTTNTLKPTRRGGLVPFLIHKIFQLDYNRTSGEFRILENLTPYEHQDNSNKHLSASQKGSKDTTEGTVYSGSTGAWSSEISVTRVTWNSGSGVARAPLLASATASGLCRIDWLLGRFVQGRFPYQSIQLLRGEIEGDIDAEGEEDD